MVVELIAKDKDEKLQHQGRCKLVIDSVSKLLLVEPFIEEFKMISAMFKWEFVVQENILFVFAEFIFQDFALIFENTNKCNKAYEFLLSKGAIPGNVKLIQQRFLPPLLSEISKNDETTFELKRILAKWIKQHKGNEKEEYIQKLKDHNVYNLIFQSKDNFEIKCEINDTTDETRNEARRSLRKRLRTNYKNQKYCLNKSMDESDSERPPLKRSRKSKNSTTNETGLNSNIYKTGKSKLLFFGDYRNKVIRPSAFEIFNYERKGIKKSKLIVFASADKKLCYEYFWSNFAQMYGCCECGQKKMRQVWAKLVKSNDGTQCIKLKSKHICEPRKYKPEKYKIVNDQIIQSPNFKIIHFQQHGIDKSRLFIFSSTDRSLCYEYFWENGCKLYQCCGCELKNKRVSAEVLEKNGKEYVELRLAQHICELRKYQPEKYVTDASKEIVENSNFTLFYYTQRNVTKKTLVIFPDSERKFCYEYYWCKTEDRFICGICSGKKYVYAHICQNVDGEDYVKLSKNQHVCSLRVFQEDNYKSDVIFRKPEYEFVEEIIRGVTKKNLLIFDSQNKELSYHFSYWPSSKDYRCTKCNNMKTRIYANVNTDQEGNEYISMKNCQHLCKPSKYQPYDASRIIKQPNYQLVEETFRRKIVQRLIVFCDNDRKMCYEYSWTGKDKTYVCHPCRGCKNSVRVKIIKNESNEECVELSKNEHKCKPIKFCITKYNAKK